MRQRDFIIRYNTCFAKYGDKDVRRQLLLYAIDIYDIIYPDNEYAAVRESAYESYVASINDVEHSNEVRDTCRAHLKLAKKHKDLFMTSRWYLMLYYASHVRNNMASEFSLMFIIYSMRVAFLARQLRKATKKKSRLLSDEYLSRLNYGYMIHWKERLHEMAYISMAGCFEQYSENNVFFTKDEWSEMYNLKEAIAVRNRYKNAHTINASSNSIMKYIDVAKLSILSRNYREAINTLMPIVEYFKENKLPPNTSLYSVHVILATIALTVEDYEMAIEHYEECMEIAKRLNYKACYGVRLGLARAYLYHGDIEKSKDINYHLYVDLKEVDRDNRGTYFAEMYYNTACRYLVLDNREQAEKFFLHAIVQFKSCSIYGNRRDVGIARCQNKLGYMLYEEKIEEATHNFSEAYKSFEKCLGDKHVETIRCKEMLDKCKKSLR